RYSALRGAPPDYASPFAVNRYDVHAEEATVPRAYVAEASTSARQPWASRDPLRRRMLALADVGAAVTATASLAIFGAGITAAAEAVVFLPVWILAVEVYGLYARDH